MQAERLLHSPGTADAKLPLPLRALSKHAVEEYHPTAYLSLLLEDKHIGDNGRPLLQIVSLDLVASCR
jgi:hypothetical protein